MSDWKSHETQSTRASQKILPREKKRAKFASQKVMFLKQNCMRLWQPYHNHHNKTSERIDFDKMTTKLGPRLIGSTYYRSFRCLWMLEELGIPYQYEVRPNDEHDSWSSSILYLTHRFLNHNSLDIHNLKLFSSTIRWGRFRSWWKKMDFPCSKVVLSTPFSETNTGAQTPHWFLSAEPIQEDSMNRQYQCSLLNWTLKDYGFIESMKQWATSSPLFQMPLRMRESISTRRIERW